MSFLAALLLSFTTPSCAIVGDSIAVGISMQRPQCTRHARVGWTSQQWNRNNRGVSADRVVISLGSNDHRYINTTRELREVRRKIHSNNVTWVLPAGVARRAGVSVADIRRSINTVAVSYGDRVVAIPTVSRDGIHPANYRQLARVALP